MASTTPGNEEPLLAQARRAAELLNQALATAQQEADDGASAGRVVMLVETAMRDCLRRLEQTGCWGEANRRAAGLIWELAGDRLKTGWLQWRAREKPRGYAGDFELFDKIESRWTCDDPLGHAFDVFFQNQPAVQAVRNRHQWLREAMVDVARSRRLGERTRWVSVGCGPAGDVKGALLDLTRVERTQIEVTLMDLDPAAIDYARNALAGLLSPNQVVAVRENLFRLSRVAGKAACLRGADFLSCPGLFDYLTDDDAAALLATFWRKLAPGGRLMVFNFAPDHPSRAYMEWFGAWYLTYRTRADFERLVRQSGIPSERVTLTSEATMSGLAVIADKPAR